MRILRVARFAARFGFRVAPATLRLMRAMVEAGEADALVAERVWQELARRPDGSLAVENVRAAAQLRRARARAARAGRGLGEFAAATRAPGAPWTTPRRSGRALEVRYAVLACALAGAGCARAELRHMSARLRAPADARDLALLALRQRERDRPGREARMPRRSSPCSRPAMPGAGPSASSQLLQAAESCSGGREQSLAARRGCAPRCVAARAVDAGAIARRESEPHRIAARLRSARMAAVRSALGIAMICAPDDRRIKSAAVLAAAGTGAQPRRRACAWRLLLRSAATTFAFPPAILPCFGRSICSHGWPATCCAWGFPATSTSARCRWRWPRFRWCCWQA